MFGIKLSPIVRQYVIVIVVNLCIITAGMGLIWPSPMLVKLRNETETVLPQPITEQEGSWIASIGWISLLITNFLVMYLLDHLGRKFCLLMSCFTRLVSAIMLTFSTKYWIILLARVISGVSDSFAYSPVATYASEIASKEVRGALSSILQICSSVGVVIALGVGPFVSYFTLNLIYTCLVVAVFIPIWFVPDSPYFVYTKGRVDEATNLLIYLRGSEMLAKEEIKEYSILNKDEKINKKDLFKDRIVVKGFIIVIILGAGVQLVGFNAVSFYLQTILESTNTSVRPEIASVVIGLIQLFAAFCATLTTDRFGRKPIIITTLIGMALGMIGLGYFFNVRREGEVVTGLLNYLPIISIILVVFCYSSGIGCLMWSLIAELFDGPARGIGVITSQCVTAVFAFLTTKYFALVTITVGPSATYWFFCVSCVILLIFIAVYVPETKGKTFVEIQNDLRGGRKERNAIE